jgi:hypothetical protein
MSVPEYRPDGDYEGEDSIPQPEDGGEVGDTLARIDAQNMAMQSIRELSMYAQRGDEEALEGMKNLAESLCDLLAREALRSELAEDVWQRLVRRSHAWPVDLPAEVKSREKALEIFVKMPLGEEVGWKLTKEHKRGRSADWSEGSQVRVAWSLMRCIEDVRDTIRTYRAPHLELLQVNMKLEALRNLHARPDHDIEAVAKVAVEIKELEKRAHEIYMKPLSINDPAPTDEAWAEHYAFSETLVGRIRGLPNFSKETVAAWCEVAIKATQSGSWRFKGVVPEEWAEKARVLEKGISQNLASKLRGGMNFIAPQVCKD